MDVFSELLYLLVNELRKHPRLRNVLGLVFGIGSIITIIAFFYVANLPEADENPSDLRKILPSVLAAMLIGLFLVLQSFVGPKIGSEIVQIEEVRQERQEIKKQLKGDKNSVRNTIQLGLNEIKEYYIINKGQAKSSFRFSVLAITIGLLTLFGGIWIFYFGEKRNMELTALTSISGMIIQFIGGFNFYLYSKSQEQLKHFYNQLIKMQDTMLAVELCNDLSKDRQAEVKEKLIMALIERSSKISWEIDSSDEQQSIQEESS